MYIVVLSSNAQQFFERSMAQLQQRLDRCFEQLKVDPRRHPNIKPLKGTLAGYYRYRVGNYRVVYYINDQDSQVVIAVIAHRSDVYE